jgi:hypothetical protein
MPSELTESDILVLLSERRRRILLRILQESNAPLSLDEVANRIAERTPPRPTEAGRGNVRLSLHHNPLPRLAEADAIVYDESEGTVVPGPNFDILVRTLEKTTERERPWSDA